MGYAEGFCAMHERKVVGAQMLEESLSGVGTLVRCLERDVWSLVKRFREATDQYPPSPSPRPIHKWNYNTQDAPRDVIHAQNFLHFRRPRMTSAVSRQPRNIGLSHLIIFLFHHGQSENCVPRHSLSVTRQNNSLLFLPAVDILYVRVLL